MTAILREIGLRGLPDVEAEDILETAYKIQDMAATAAAPAAAAPAAHTHRVLDKSNALLEYLQKYSRELAASQRADLFSALKDIRWVRRMEQRPVFYPKALDWFSSPHLLEKPCDTVPKQYTNLAGSVMPTHAYEMRGGGEGAGLVEAFGWHAPPPLPAILRHFATVVRQYDGTEKAKFMDIAASVYTLLAARTSRQPEEGEEEPMEELMREMREIGLEEYIWHGEGFCRPQQVVFSESFMDLRPFVFPLPTEMAVFGEFFSRCGVRDSCHLPDILATIKAKYDAGPPANTHWGLSEVKRDLHICVSVLNELKGEEQLFASFS
jgi:sacsin